MTHITQRAARPWCPPRPVPPPLRYLVDGDRFVVPGLAVVLARPHRRPAEAAAIAGRVACNPDGYLAVLAACSAAFPVRASGRLAVAHG